MAGHESVMEAGILQISEKEKGRLQSHMGVSSGAALRNFLSSSIIADSENSQAWSVKICGLWNEWVAGNYRPQGLTGALDISNRMPGSCF